MSYDSALNLFNESHRADLCRGRKKHIFPSKAVCSMNTECKRIAHQLACVVAGEAWYGDSLQAILGDVTAAQAKARPLPGAHSIWELLFHVESWVKMTLSAIDGVPIPPWPGMTVELDWPPVTDTSAAAWKLSVDSFFFYHFRLVEKIEGFTNDDLHAVVPGRTYDFGRLFEGTIQHLVYHAGQISVLKKAGAGR